MKVPREVLPTIGLTLLAHVPCCLPTLLLAIGGAASSALASRLAWLHSLDAFRPYFMGISVITMGIAFWAAYRPVDECLCRDHTDKDHALERRIKIGTVWAVAVLAVAINYFAIQADQRYHHGSPVASISKHN